MYIDSERQLQIIVGKLLSLVNLTETEDSFEYIKKYLKELEKKHNPVKDQYGVEPDGTQVLLKTKEKVGQEFS